MNSEIFQGKINQSSATLLVQKKFIVLSFRSSLIEFELNLFSYIGFSVSKGQLFSLCLNEYEFQSSHENLMKIKTLLGGLVTFQGLLNHYTFIRTLKQTKKTNVCLLKCNFTEQLYAVKCIKKEAENKKYVHNEIRIQRSLEHKNIAKLSEVYESNKNYYLIIEYLTNEIDRRFKHLEIKVILKQILDALHYMNEKHVIHRDLKLTNIMLDQNQQLKIIDFGLAVNLEEKNDEKIIIGTPGYIAPEILMKQIPSYSQDMFSLGCMMYELYTARPLIYDKSFKKTLILNASFDLKDIILPEIPDFGTDLLQSLLQNNSELRLCSMDAPLHPYFQDDLQEKANITIPSFNPVFKLNLNNQSYKNGNLRK